jgi:hypothetical protein
MAEVQSALLCDYAQVREGLLFICSGGITRIGVQHVGDPVQFFVAGHVELHPDELGRHHDLEFKVVPVNSARPVWAASIGIQTNATVDGLFPGEITQIPFALAVGPFESIELGPHDVRVTINNDETELLTFYVVQFTARPQPG